jgi:pectate lyase
MKVRTPYFSRKPEKMNIITGLPSVMRTGRNRPATFVLITLIILAAGPAKGLEGQSMLPSFPGAEGYGALTPGGRGGRVIKVTNLNTSGPGSFQEAVSAEGPRIVVFEVSGVIHGPVEIKHGQITIMGQTAPGAGITIQGMLHTSYDVADKLEDIVVRFLRVRPNPVLVGNNGDAIQFSRARRCVLDHISCSWATDETIDIYSAEEVTVQWCAIEESDPDGAQHQNYGLIGGPDGHTVSIHHNLFANHKRRCPALANGPADIRNNVIYNFRDGLSHEGHISNNLGFNIVGNYYKQGPNDIIFPFNFVGGVSYHLRDNYFESRESGYTGMIQDPWAEADKIFGLQYYAKKGIKADKEFETPRTTTHTPKEAYDLVLAQAGCFPRDSVSRRTVTEVQTGAGAWKRRAPDDLMAGLVPGEAPLDSDGDGMPDAWESSHGLNPADYTDYSKVMISGYTAIEEYCNMLAAELLDKAGN